MVMKQARSLCLSIHEASALLQPARLLGRLTSWGPSPRYLLRVGNRAGRSTTFLHGGVTVLELSPATRSFPKAVMYLPVVGRQFCALAANMNRS